jgi:hypothetical protein
MDIRASRTKKIQVRRPARAQMGKAPARTETCGGGHDPVHAWRKGMASPDTGCHRQHLFASESLGLTFLVIARQPLCVRQRRHEQGPTPITSVVGKAQAHELHFSGATAGRAASFTPSDQ